ncbi:hypothetical protein [Leucobacter chromiireducens]|uniref:hypothetical protein n=1 Tax=Leucobacter chromiireducens TaxID=283877 RepID=UPI0019279687|nr:hypothetical protein [Leucobacter chromiireducens]
MIARAEDPLVNFECGLTDFLCASMEDTANWTVSAINWLAELSLGGQGFRPGNELWNTAQSEAGVWLGMAIFVMFITFIVGIAAGAVMQRPDLIKRTALASIAALPAFYFSYFIVGQGLQIIDEFSAGILARLTGEGGFAGMFETLFAGQANWGAHTIGAAVGAAPVMQMMMVLVIMFIGLFFITFAMAFRDFVLMILITFAPLAFVLLPGKGNGDEWVKRWMSAVTAMALAKPLILGTLILVMAGLGSVDSILSGEGLTLAIGLFITAFMPILAYSFFQFMGGGAGGDEVGQRAGSSAVQKTQRVVSSAGRRIPNGGGGGRSGGGQPQPASSPAVSGSSGAPSTPGTKPGAGGSPPTQPERPGQGPAADGRFGGQPSVPEPRSTDPSPGATPPSSPSPTPSPEPGPRGGNAPSPANPPRERPPASPTLTGPSDPRPPREPKP